MKKSRLPVVLLAGALAGTVLLAGCGRAASADSAAVASGSTASPATPDAAADSAAAAPDTAPVSLSGTVSNASMSQFTLTTAEGEVVEVLLADNVQNNLANGLADGNEVQVGGTRQADGTVTALSLSDTAAAAGALVYLTGTAADVTDTQFTLQQEDGTAVTVLLADNTQLTPADSLTDGASVAVGGTSQPDGTVQAAAVMDNAASAEVVPQAPAGWVTLTGTVADAMMNGFTLNTDDGQSVQVIKTDTTTTMLANGLADGNKVMVAGTQDGSTVTASHISDAQ